MSEFAWSCINEEMAEHRSKGHQSLPFYLVINPSLFLCPPALFPAQNPLAFSVLEVTGVNLCWSLPVDCLMDGLSPTFLFSLLSHLGQNWPNLQQSITQEGGGVVVALLKEARNSLAKGELVPCAEKCRVLEQLAWDKLHSWPWHEVHAHM